MTRAPFTFRRLLAEAIAELSASGYVSPERIQEWIVRLRNAAEAELGPPEAIDRQTAETLDAIFRRLADAGRVVDYVPGVTRLGLEMVKSQLRAELDRRILAAADLIKLHRKEAIETTLARFSGWSTSIPPGGAGVIDKRAVRSHIAKDLAHFRFEQRRVSTDQGHKLLSNIASIVATDAGAIAGVWHSHGEHDASYDARPEHLARAGKVYAIRDCWAMQQGLMHKGAGHTDEITAPGQEVFCRCFYTYITSPRRLPPEMLTAKGRAWIERGREAAERMRA